MNGLPGGVRRDQVEDIFRVGREDGMQKVDDDRNERTNDRRGSPELEEYRLAHRVSRQLTLDLPLQKTVVGSDIHAHPTTHSPSQ